MDGDHRTSALAHCRNTPTWILYALNFVNTCTWYADPMPCDSSRADAIHHQAKTDLDPNRGFERLTFWTEHHDSELFAERNQQYRR